MYFGRLKGLWVSKPEVYKIIDTELSTKDKTLPCRPETCSLLVTILGNFGTKMNHQQTF